MPSVYKSRREQLFNELPSNVNTVILSPSKPLHYFTGITQSPLEKHNSERVFLVILSRNRDVNVVLPKIETARVQSTLGNNADLHTYQHENVGNPLISASETVNKVFQNKNFHEKAAFGYRYTRLLEYSLFQDKYTWEEVINLDDVFAGLRIVKDDDELAAMERSGEIIDDCLSKTLDQIETGMTEAEVESTLKKHILDSDASNWGVTLILSGERTANVLADTSNRIIEEGDLVLIDTGAVYRGYYTDVTRTVAVGDINPELKEMYQVVQKANQSARLTVKDGTRCSDIVTAANEVVEKEGYEDVGEQEGRLGHGIGLDGHEPPYLSPDSKQKLQTSNVITIEPGIYVEGLGGVRIEDNIIITDEGHKTLTNLPRELITVG